MEESEGLEGEEETGLVSAQEYQEEEEKARDAR